MYIYIFIYTCTYIHMSYICIYIYIYVYIFIYMYIYVCIYIDIYIYVHTYKYTHVQMYMYIFTHVLTCTLTYKPPPQLAAQHVGYCASAHAWEATTPSTLLLRALQKKCCCGFRASREPHCHSDNITHRIIYYFETLHNKSWIPYYAPSYFPPCKL